MQTCRSDEPANRLIGCVCAVFVLLFSPTVLAEPDEATANPAPIDLLGNTNDDAVTKNPEVARDSITAQSIDDAIKLVTDDKATIDGAATDNATTQAEETSGQSGATLLPVTEIGSTSSDSSQDNPAQASVTVGLRKMEDVGLAAIGVRETPNGGGNLDELIWRGTPASRAAFLFENGRLTSQSRALAQLALDVMAKEAVPPAGANLVATDLVKARLGWLAAAGRSHDLAVLVKRLPNDDEWLDWKKWLVEYQLMQRHDQDACKTVSAFTARTLDPYWHKLKVVCNIVQADVSSARFGADILAASGVDDPVFFALVEEMLNGKEAQALDPALVEPLHVVLMDAAHHEISLDSLGTLPPQTAQAVVAMRYLGTDARMVSTFDGLAKGLISPEEASKLWRSATAMAEPGLNALARHTSGPTPLTTAMSWRAIAVDQTGSRLALIAQAMKTDIQNGHGLMMAPLYAALARDAVEKATPGTLDSMGKKQITAQIGLLLAVNNPRDEFLIDGALAGPLAGDAATVLKMLDDGIWNGRAFASLDLWHLLPLFEAAGVVPEDQEWIDQLSDKPINGHDYLVLSPLMLKAIAAAAEKRRVAETVLLAGWAVGQTPLHQINPQDAAAIVKAFNAIGQTVTGRAFAREIVTAHLLERFAAAIPPMAALDEFQPDQADNSGDVVNASASPVEGGDVTSAADGSQSAGESTATMQE